MAGEAKKILVADDEKSLVRLLRISFEIEGFHVVEAYDGEEALEKTNAEKPDIILLDILMPKMNGLSVLENLKQNPETSNIPIVILSAKITQEDKKRSSELGAVQYITKPFNPIQLVKIIRKMI